MSFTDIVRRKIEASRAGDAPRAAAEAAREARLRAFAAPLTTAIEAMMARLLADPMFATAIGNPGMAIKPWEEPSTITGTIRLAGTAACLNFVLGTQGYLSSVSRIKRQDCVTYERPVCYKFGGAGPPEESKTTAADAPRLLSDDLVGFAADWDIRC
jgi:hypothetical protein